MNILYVVKGLSIIEPLGILQLSAITKLEGHSSFLGVIEEGDVINKIEKYNIDLVAFSVLSTEAKNFFQLAQQIRRSYHNITIIVGGPHPTHFPKIADIWPIDAVVIGEGDFIIGKITENLTAGKDLSNIHNVHTKHHKSELLPLVDNLDEIPYPDRDLIHNVAPFKYIRMKSFMASRGCPYNCAYCFNNAYKNLYKKRGKMYRRRSVENLIREIELVKEKYPMDSLRFGDDVFITKYDDWIEEFAEKYSSRISLPFYFLISPNLITKKLIKLLKDAGLHSIGLSIETGNEELRRTVLKRPITNETILNAYSILHDFDINTFSNSILGLPDSSLEDDLMSLNFSFRCKPTYNSFTVFTPFPGTELHKLCEEKGYLKNVSSFDDDEFPDSMFQSSCLNNISEKRKEIHKNILMLGALANSMSFLRKIITNHLIYWKPNIFFSIIGFFTRNYLQMKIWYFRMNPIAFLRILWRVISIDRMNYASRRKNSKLK